MHSACTHAYIRSIMHYVPGHTCVLPVLVHYGLDIRACCLYSCITAWTHVRAACTRALRSGHTCVLPLLMHYGLDTRACCL